ncbi:hypothetical protein N9I52_02125 [Acidimicrobiia bacterium]|nr:hypothetical protein [Acidimicrobiia bacterium]
MKFLNLENILCLSPHPDDAEYSVLGSIIKFIDTNFEIVTFSIGGSFDKTTSDKRMDECKAVWENIENLKGYFFDLDHIKNMGEDEMIYEIEQQYDIEKYDAIMIPAIDTHQDHKKINGVGMALTRKTKCGIIEYQTPHTLNVWTPNLFIDVGISKDIESGVSIFQTKKERIKKFKSQVNQPYFTDEAIQDFHKDFQSTRRGIHFVESFKIISNYN